MYNLKLVKRNTEALLPTSHVAVDMASVGVALRFERDDDYGVQTCSDFRVGG